jgi:hypothetical protein
VAVDIHRLERELTELITALDRRVPRLDRVAEPTIARDAAALRARAQKRLTELYYREPSEAPAARPAGDRTIFPVLPSDVAALPVHEFTVDLETDQIASIDAICKAFTGDANRALVWLIRFRALNTLCARADVAAWRREGLHTSRDICEVAARFGLNDQWEFDSVQFCAAVDRLVDQRSSQHDESLRDA